MSKLMLAFFILLSAVSTCYGWSGNKHQILTCSWSSRNLGGCGYRTVEFDYKPEDKLYFSLTKPSSANDGIQINANEWVRPGNGDAIRFEGVPSNGVLTLRVGADTDDDLDGLHSGTFYAWYGNDGILYEFEYTNYYTPIAEVSLSSSVIDLGSCIKSSTDTGIKLEKKVNIPITLRGYAPNSSYSFSRVITSVNSPVAVSYLDKDHKAITTGQQNVLINSLSGTFPKKMDDVINVRLECDKINAGEYTWALNVEYIIP